MPASGGVNPEWAAKFRGFRRATQHKPIARLGQSYGLSNPVRLVLVIGSSTFDGGVLPLRYFHRSDFSLKVCNTVEQCLKSLSATKIVMPLGRVIPVVPLSRYMMSERSGYVL